MLNRLFPGTDSFFTCFEQQNRILQKMTGLLGQELSLDRHMENPSRELSDLETEADVLQNKIIREIAQTFITPIDREDIYAISMAQERVIDSLKSLGDRFQIFSFVHVRFPAQKCVDDMHVMSVTIGEILECIRNKQSPDAPIREMHTLKDNCAMLTGVGLAELYDMDMNSLEQVRQLLIWAQLYDRIEQSLQLFAELTDTLEQAVLKYV